MREKIIPPFSEKIEAKYSRAQLESDIDSALRDGMNLKINEGETVNLEFEDDAGHHYVHELAKREANNVDEGLWTTGSYPGVENMRNKILNEIKTAGFNLDSGRPIEVRVQTESEQRKAA